MIAANHSNLADAVFFPYMKYLHRNAFRSLSIVGNLPALPENQAILLLPNHATWWDGFFVYMLNKYIIRKTLYIMMLEKRLKEFPFFARVGAYSINPEQAKDSITTLQYTTTLLDQPSSLVCIFPQGELMPPNTFPLPLKGGFLRSLKNISRPVSILPLAIKTVFLQEQRPHVFFSCSAILQHQPEQTAPSITDLQELLHVQLSLTEKAIAGELPYRPFFVGKSSPGEPELPPMLQS